jgi:hypothetical protein
MAEPADMILPLLREMRPENAERHAQSLERFTAVERPLDRMEESLGSFRQALSADSLLSKIVRGEFEERLEALECKVRELETSK